MVVKEFVCLGAHFLNSVTLQTLTPDSIAWFIVSKCGNYAPATCYSASGRMYYGQIAIKKGGKGETESRFEGWEQGRDQCQVDTPFGFW